MLDGGLQAFAELNGPVLADMLVQASPLIDVKRVYVTFGAPAAASVVWDGMTFATRKAARLMKLLTSLGTRRCAKHYTTLSESR